MKLKDKCKTNYLHPAGAISCPNCWNDLNYVTNITDNPHEDLIGHCPKCDQLWTIRVEYAYEDENQIIIQKTTEEERKLIEKHKKPVIGFLDKLKDQLEKEV